MKSIESTMTGEGIAPRVQFQIMQGTEDRSTTGHPACDRFRELIARVNNGERDPREGDWSLRPVLEDGTTYAGGWETITRNARGEYCGRAKIVCHVFSPVDRANRQTIWTLYADGSALTQEITRHLSYAGSERCTYSESHEAGSEEALLVRRMANAESLADGYFRVG